MLSAAVLALLTVSAFARPVAEHFSTSLMVGSGSGTSVRLEGEGRITAARVWSSGYIRGMQLRYGGTWSAVIGYTYSTPVEFELFEDETIVMVSGTASHYIQSLVFVTSRGRSFPVGSRGGYEFITYARTPQAELLGFSARVHGALTTISSHWGLINDH